jgi:hypothetical protein
VLERLEEIEEPQSLRRLRTRVSAQLPQVQASEILLEIAARTRFDEEFRHVSESQATTGSSAASRPTCGAAEETDAAQAESRVVFPLPAKADRSVKECVAKRCAQELLEVIMPLPTRRLCEWLSFKRRGSSDRKRASERSGSLHPFAFQSPNDYRKAYPHFLFQSYDTPNPRQGGRRHRLLQGRGCGGTEGAPFQLAPLPFFLMGCADSADPSSASTAWRDRLSVGGSPTEGLPPDARPRLPHCHRASGPHPCGRASPSQ